MKNLKTFENFSINEKKLSINRSKLLDIAQNYLGMKPNDRSCKNWKEMQEKMVDEILSSIS